MIESVFESVHKVYTKYVGGGGEVGRGEGGGFYKFYKKYLVAHGIKDLNISWSSRFFIKNVLAPPINFSFLFIAYLQ